MIKCIAFDIGNTLHITNNKILEICWKEQIKSLKSKGYSVEFDDFKKAVSKAWAERAQEKRGKKQLNLSAKTLKNLNIENKKLADFLTKEFFRIRIEKEGKNSVAPGTKKLFAYLKNKKILVGIISDADISWARAWLKKNNLKIQSKMIVISNEIRASKTSIKPFKVFFSKAKKEIKRLEKKQCLMVGDKENDLNAKKLGFQTCLFNPNKKSIEHFKTKPDFTIKNMLEIKKIISQY